jgi:hypothetical protein
MTGIAPSSGHLLLLCARSSSTVPDLFPTAHGVGTNTNRAVEPRCSRAGEQSADLMRLLGDEADDVIAAQ